MRPSRSPYTWSLLLFAACGCSSAPKESAEAIVSWAATVELVSAHWSDGRVPSRYARRTLENAERSLSRHLERLRSSNPPVSEELQHAGAELGTAVAAVRSAIETRDRDRVRSESARVRALKARLEGARPR
jgi:hypothetical protein